MVLQSYLRDFHNQTESHGELLRSRQSGSADFSHAFRVLANRIVIAGEITDDYMGRLTRPVDPLTQDEVRQRLKYVYRDLLFIGNMASIEYYLIKYLQLYPELTAAQEISRRGERRVQMSELLSWIHDLLDDTYLWDFAVKFRNDVVHFDARARQYMESPSIEFPITMTEGEEATGVLRAILSLSSSIEKSFYSLVSGLINSDDPGNRGPSAPGMVS